jgi:hypothetical protein
MSQAQTLYRVPTDICDPYQCALANIPYYLTAGPSPSGALASALCPFNPAQFRPEASTVRSLARFRQRCCRRTHSTYASLAESWRSDGNRDKVVSLVTDCPYLWYDALLINPADGANLNRTVADAQCWAEAHPTGCGGTATMSDASTGTKGSSGPV